MQEIPNANLLSTKRERKQANALSFVTDIFTAFFSELKYIVAFAYVHKHTTQGASFLDSLKLFCVNNLTKFSLHISTCISEYLFPCLEL